MTTYSIDLNFGAVTARVDVPEAYVNEVTQHGDLWNAANTAMNDPNSALGRWLRSYFRLWLYDIERL